MSHTKFGSSSLSDQDVRHAEHMIGPIPNALLAIHRCQNGGVLERSLFISDAEDEYVMEYLFPIPEGGLEPAEQDMVRVNTALQREQLIPADHLAFGMDGGGNYFSVARSDGSVWYHPLDTWEEDQSPAENHARTMERLSGSVTDFFDNLTEQ
ncbi:SMI1/KNR4 family protein [uncultured Sphingomonas sp.]|uniref:SMI1/KNR4 family protein n=1 Tax=uncultured Sphingomonas sp. TaxID=158754 RepID=UPI0025E5E6A5|nr:SMI1/KNR4 family protein [uncultured Sphingomonas sp.]